VLDDFGEHRSDVRSMVTRVVLAVLFVSHMFSSVVPSPSLLFCLPVNLNHQETIIRSLLDAAVEFTDRQTWLDQSRMD
jgi:hypothetical protein